MKYQIIILFVLAVLSACSKEKNSGIAQQPTLADYEVGEKWVWKFKGVTTDGEVRSDGTDTREIVDMGGALGITIGNDTIPVADIVKPEESETPKYDWPLEAGKKWTYANSWTSQDGTTGEQYAPSGLLGPVVLTPLQACHLK